MSVLDGGINRWVTDGLATEWGTNVPSKDFGEKVEVVHHVPEIEAKELAERMHKGEKFVILDTRTPEEFRRFCIPGGRSVPGGELALRITDITKNVDRDTTIIVNCAGRTRSIIGTRVLQRMGLSNVYGLKNGTAGWMLAGHQLESGADRVQLPEPSAEAVAAAEAYAARLAIEDGVRSSRRAGPGAALMDRRRTESVYLHRRADASRSTPPATFPASGGSRAARRCSAPTRWPWSSTARSCSPAIGRRGPR